VAQVLWTWGRTGCGLADGYPTLLFEQGGGRKGKDEG